MANVKDDLVAEINRTMETLGAIELTNEEYSEASNNVTKLVAKVIDLEKIETERAKIELETKKLENECIKSGADIETNRMRAQAEHDKVELEAQRIGVDIDKFNRECEIRNRQDKSANLDRWINIGVTVGLGLIGLGVQVWANKSSMNYEVTGHYPTTEVGRNSQRKLLNWKF